MFNIVIVTLERTYKSERINDIYFDSVNEFELEEDDDENEEDVDGNEDFDSERFIDDENFEFEFSDDEKFEKDEDDPNNCNECIRLRIVSEELGNSNTTNTFCGKHGLTYVYNIGL